MTLSKKIDYAIVVEVKGANPNGDPLEQNMPRTTIDDLGEITDVCGKRKIRDRLIEKGENIFVQSDNNKVDDFPSLRKRAESVFPSGATTEEIETLACETWFDVRAYGQMFAYSSKNKGEGLSVGIRGPVTLQHAESVEPIHITSTQIVKSVNSEGEKGDKRGSDTMGMKHRVDYGVYTFFGSMNPALAERTGFTDEDAEKIKSVLPIMYENDASSARPEGSMSVLKVVWWEHSCKTGDASSAKMHRSLQVNPDGTIEFTGQPGPKPEIIEGF